MTSVAKNFCKIDKGKLVLVLEVFRFFMSVSIENIIFQTELVNRRWSRSLVVGKFFLPSGREKLSKHIGGLEEEKFSKLYFILRWNEIAVSWSGNVEKEFYWDKREIWFAYKVLNKFNILLLFSHYSFENLLTNRQVWFWHLQVNFTLWIFLELMQLFFGQFEVFLKPQLHYTASTQKKFIEV